MNWLQQTIDQIKPEGEKIITLSSFAKLCDINENTIMRIIREDIPVYLLTLSLAEQISNGLNLSITEFLYRYYDGDI